MSGMKNKRKYTKAAFFPFCFSIGIHGLFFLGVNADFKDVIRTESKIFFIENYQIEKIENLAEGMFVEPIFENLAKKKSIWKNELDLGKQMLPNQLEFKEHNKESTGIGEREVYLKKIPSDQSLSDISYKDTNPNYLSLFNERLPKIDRGREDSKKINELTLEGGVKVFYFIMGPLSKRELVNSETFEDGFVLQETDLDVMLRVWVNRNGMVDQTIVEKGTGFPLIDSKVLKAVKKWRFGVVYDLKSPKYQWGVVGVMLKK